MHSIESWLSQFGVLLVYVNVAADAGGLPFPSFPLLLLCGALVKTGGLSVLEVLFAALFGALTADLTWYYLGRAHGRRLLAALCRISLSPDSCVRQTESIFLRYGPKSLLVAKFIPGFAVVAASMAGRMKIGLWTFVLIDVCGVLIWSGSWVIAGMLAGPLVSDLVESLQNYGTWGAAFLVAAFAIYLGWKWLQRRAAESDRAIPRVTIDELRQLIGSNNSVVLVDVRSKEIQALEGRIPGALSLAVDSPAEDLMRIPANSHIIVYCGCPNEMSAVHMVKRLQMLGRTRAQPLAGGVDSWSAAGMPLESGAGIPTKDLTR